MEGSLLNLSQTLNTHWVWFVGVVLGSIIALKLQGLENELRPQSREGGSQPLPARAKHLFGAVAFFVFFAYHVGAYHMLIHDFPYKASLFSGGRYVIDLIMAFCLMAMLTNGVSRRGHERSLGILIALTLWHSSAASWQFLASIEYYDKAPSAIMYLPHFVFISIYWAVWPLLWLVLRIVGIVGRGHPVTVLRLPAFFVTLSVAVFAIAVYRYTQLFDILVQSTAVATPGP
jgi:hypothetical protein